jgi:hypothetical protein
MYRVLYITFCILKTTRLLTKLFPQICKYIALHINADFAHLIITIYLTINVCYRLPLWYQCILSIGQLIIIEHLFHMSTTQLPDNIFQLVFDGGYDLVIISLRFEDGLPSLCWIGLATHNI